MSAFNKHIVSGRVGKKPELRYSVQGTPIASFSLARQIRRLNRQTNQWEDGDLTWYDVTAFNRLAENIVASLDKGVEVTVIGELKVSSYKSRDGEARQSLELNADDITVSLDHQVVEVTDRSAYGTKVNGGVDSGTSTPRGNSSYSNAPTNDVAGDDTPF